MVEKKFKNTMAILFFLVPLNCLAQSPPPFSNVEPRPPIHPYTYFGPESTPMDLQQIRYLRDKYEWKKEKQGRSDRRYMPYDPPPGPGIRPTGHRTYFMNIP